MRLDERLKQLREERGYMQRDVAHDLGIAPNTLSGYERGVRIPDAETLKKLASYYGSTVDSLLGSNTSLSELEQEMPEGVTALRRMKNMNKDARKKMLSLINTMIDNEEKELRERSKNGEEN